MSYVKHSINLEKVSHSYRSATSEVQLFKNLSLTIETGRSLSIVGASGAGKSTLLSLIAALEPPTKGHITYQLGDQTLPAEKLRKNSGFIFQQFHLIPELDALTNVALPLLLHGDNQAYMKASCWLEKIGLSARSSFKSNQLSGGEQQRVAIARAFISEPHFVFADEPTGNLDEDTSAHVSQLMFDCARKTGSALVLVSHNPTLAAEADDCYRLSQGKLELRQ
ncbi:ABC transporter ATP-binding protein [Microbulbifer sp. 2201CG32-9]|uniref:ABC transporter ATP-binding protein n=1 Tax=Microbulbifer sp. 2201CG32-9 TaxID=3232309 RepID=UPI00345C233E